MTDVAYEYLYIYDGGSKRYATRLIKKNASNASYSSYFNIETAKFNAFVAFLC